MALTEQEIRQITDEIVKTLSGALKPAASPAAPAPKAVPAAGCTGRWLCDTAEEAIANAKAAQQKLAEGTLELRGELIAAMRKAAIDNAEPLARLANEETGYGRVADKIQKNLLVARRTPGIEDLSTYCKTGDNGMIGRAEAALVISKEAPPPSDLTIVGIIDPETL